MWMPEWLYERMPLLYPLAGSLCLWLLGPSIAAASSAALLFGAGMTCFALRRRARRPVLARQSGTAR